ncbi:MAG: hypothetical protein E7Z93_00030 [Cyanobacteria bacterium SIG32]|nr:hypothetical protein [Cyanobacteria bacterium SIG32]
MKKIYLTLCLFLSITSLQAQTIDYAKDGFPPLQAPIVPMTTPKYQRFHKEQTPKFTKLNKLERKVFGRTYEDDSPENRIAKLEEQIFGTIQSGNINNRYLVLQKAVPKYISQSYETDYSPYCTTSTGNSWKNIVGPLGNFFNMGYMGYPTGMTPQINMPNLNYPTNDFQRANFTNRGWDIHNQSIGSGSRVQILD